MLRNKKSDCLALEREILAWKRFDAFMCHARLLQEFWGKKCWKALGCKGPVDWIRKKYPTKGFYYPYTLLRIAETLSPYLTDEELHQIGVSNCDKLAKLVKKKKLLQPGGQPDPDIIRKAKEMRYEDFERFVDALVRGERPPELGEYLNPAFRGLQHAPVNELGVVYLFGMVSHELGFIVETIQPSYPDCHAKERIREHPEKWRPVRIEFKYRSKDFNYPPEGADILVCWEHDWPGCPVKRVIELKSKIKELPPELPKR